MSRWSAGERWGRRAPGRRPCGDWKSPSSSRGPTPPPLRRPPPGCWRLKSSPVTTCWSPCRCAPATCTSRSLPPFGKLPASTSDSGAPESSPWRSTSRQPSASRRSWPGAAPDCLGALLAPEDGALDPQALTRACLADARRLGATLYVEKVEALAIAQGRVTGVVTAQGTAPVEHAVLAAGVWSPQIRGLPQALPVEPLRGQMAATAWPDGCPPAILFHDHGYVLARGADAVLGSTMERAGYDARVTN